MSKSLRMSAILFTHSHWSFKLLTFVLLAFSSRAHSVYLQAHTDVLSPLFPTVTMQLSRCTFWRQTKPASGGSLPSTSFPSTSRARAASAAGTSSCGSAPKTWPANVPRSNQGRSTCCWGMTRTPRGRAEWWQTKAAWLSSGGTRGHAGSGSSSSARRKASARSHRRRRGRWRKETNSRAKLSGSFKKKKISKSTKKVKRGSQRTTDRQETVYVAAFLCRSMKRII